MPDPDRRPDPDLLLGRIRAEEAHADRGKLKIFLGYAAGVGKTYAMLEAAHQRLREGVDVVVAYVETHGRAETEAMIRDLELIPRRQLEYHGITLQEMDIDAVLNRHPKLVLIDELAHTNAPGSRHTKRYQDVEELLAQGIDVYSTLNIQHIESLNDVVAQITTVRVSETLPDRVIDEATELELVDLPPDELLGRLREGKVYVPEQAARAVQRFFRPGNLTALREMAMRRAAERVDDQMRAYMESRDIPGPWPAKEGLLVCVSPSPLAEHLIRSTRRLADGLKAEWVAVHVETPDDTRLTQTEHDRIFRALRLAEELGGRALTVPGRSIPDAVLGYARQHNITQIVIGKPVRPLWRDYLGGSVVDRITRASGPIDVHVISGTSEDKSSPARPTEWRPHQPWARYLQSLLLVVAGTLLSALVHPLFSPANLVMIYLLTVLVAAITLGRGPSILAAILSVAAFDFFFVPPTYTMAVANTEYILTFVALLAVSLVVSNLAVRVREQARLAIGRASQTGEMYDLSRDLAVAVDLQTILEAVLRHVSQTFDRQAVILTAYDQSDAVVPRAQTPGMELSQNELAVATWAFRHAEPAGHGTDTLPAAAVRYLPLTTSRGVVGVLGVGPSPTQANLTPDELHLLDAFASQAALAVERARLAEQARHADVLQATERLQATLLNSISHDLRTPLVAITGTLSSLQEDEGEMDASTRRSLVENAAAEADRLNRLVGNLLDMTRIEAGGLKAFLEPCELEDVVGSAMEQLENRLKDRPVTVRVPPGFPMLPMDFALMVQVFVNLLDNALKYSPSGSPIELRATIAQGAAEIEVADRGVGLPPEDLGRVFDKFYRVQRPGSVTGTGLGLSICKGIVEAHGGSIRAENRPGGGTIVIISLPLPRPSEPDAEGQE
jgi:two-component system sensor histidine kinase KdpD